MEIEKMTGAEIEERLSQIAQELEEDGADIDALTEETHKLTGRQAELRTKEQRAKELRDMIAKGRVGHEVRTFTDDQARKSEEERVMDVSSKEYRNAYLKHLQGKELSAIEERAFTVAGGATATITMNRIMDVVRQHAWLLERMTTIYSGAKVEIYIEGTNNAATDHTENQTISAAGDTLTKITLTPAEITKMIQVSDAATQMSIDVFESWLVDMLGKAIARKVNEKIITAAMAAASDKGSTFDAPTVQAVLGAVKGEDVALVCNNNTLYTKLLPLQDKSKSSIVSFEGGEARVYGRPVLLDDNMADDTLLCGDWSKAAAAIAEDVTVRKAYDIDTNSVKYLGVTVFDVKIGVASGFAKISAAA